MDPTAWVVLEELTIRSQAAPRPVAVSAEVRSLADALGRSRDAVGRALQALIEAGLVERHSSRNELTGQFGTATYRIDLDAAGLQVPAEPDASPPTSSTTFQPLQSHHEPPTPLTPNASSNHDHHPSTRPHQHPLATLTTIPSKAPQTSVTNLHSSVRLGPGPGREHRVRSNRTREHRHGGARPC